MSVEVQSVMRWSFERLMSGLGPIRIAVPAWRLPRDRAVVANGAPRLSQEELLDLFHSELRPVKRIANLPESALTSADNMQRQCMARLNSALYTS
jgi:DNA repair protein RadC